MVDIFTDPILTPREVSTYLQIPKATVYSWFKDDAGGEPLVHRVKPATQGHASVPFAALVEAYVLRALRNELGFSKAKVRAAVSDVRETFNTPFALATKRIATDGIDIFIDHGDVGPDSGLSRAGDRQTPIREMIEGYLRYITWSEDDYASRLRLKQFPSAASVVIDPRFGWGAPVVESTKVPVSAVVGLWQAGEPMSVVADEYDLTVDQVEQICRVSVRVPA